MKKLIITMLMFVITGCSTNNSAQDTANLTGDVRETNSAKCLRPHHKGPRHKGTSIKRCKPKQTATDDAQEKPSVKCHRPRHKGPSIRRCKPKPTVTA